MSSVSCSAAPALPTDPSVAAGLAPAPTDVAGVAGGGLAPAMGQPAGAATGAPVDLQTAIANLQTAVGALSQAVAGMGAISGGGGTPAELPVDPSVTGGGAGSGCGCGGGQAVAGAGSVEQVEQKTDEFATAPKEPKAPKEHKPAEAPKQSSAPAGFKIQDPLPGAKVTSTFGEVSSIRNNRPHGGTDLAKGQGTPISAAAPGKVVEVKYDPDGYGNYVTIDHGNGKFTRYGHMVEKSPLKEGDTVTAGQNIGKVGSTGNSTGPHLHFEVLIGGTGQGNRVDAQPYLSGSKTF